MAPKVSVILPNYNHAEFLTQRIDSILGQTLTDFELIIFDDKSTDNSVEIIERYRGNEKISHIFYNEINSGKPFPQWIRGMKLSSGSYIWIAESDDSAHPEFLERLVGVLDKNSAAAFVYSQSYSIDEKGAITGTGLSLTEKLDPEKWKHDFIDNGSDFIKKYMVYQNVIPNASAVLFRKSSWQQFGDPDASFQLNGDWNFWITMMAHSSVAYVSDCLNFFRTHPKTNRRTTIMKGLNYLEYARIIHRVFNLCGFDQAEKENVLDYFNAQLGFSAPITVGNLIKSYLTVAPHNLRALKLMAVQIRQRYL